VRHATGTCSAKVAIARGGAGSESVGDTPSGGEESGLRRGRRPLATAFDPACGARGTDPVEAVAARLGAVAVEVDADRAPAPAARTPGALVRERRQVALLDGRGRHGSRLTDGRVVADGVSAKPYWPESIRKGKTSPRLSSSSTPVGITVPSPL